MSSRPLLPALLAVCGLAGCLVGPDFRPPEPPVPGEWNIEGRRVRTDAAAAAWWKSFGDPLLERLVALAVERNTDVRVAIARVRQARSLRRQSTAGFFPSIDAAASYERRQPSGTTVAVQAAQFDDYSAGFDASWELDLFGGLRRAREQRSAELAAAGADLNDALVTATAEVARSYVELRSLQRRIAVAAGNERTQRETLDLARWRFEAGLVGALDVEQAEYNLAETRSRIPALEIELAAAGNRLAVLTGAPAGSLDAELSAPGPVPVPPRQIAVGLPVDLVRRRPDVVAAEHRLAAATAAIGVARADLYPRLSLGGTFQVAATDLAALDSAAARGFSVGPTLRWNVFDAGRLRAVVAERSAEADAALASWEGEVLAAVEEAASALAAFLREQDRLVELRHALESARSAHELARLEYRSGLADFQRVLEAERALLGFEESVAVSDAAVTTNLVALMKALGGGWETVGCSDAGCREAAPGASH